MKKELIANFERQFHTLETAFERTNEKAWTCPDPRLKGIWQWMDHILETIEFYMGEGPDGFQWGKRFGVDGVDWEEGSNVETPSMEAIREYYTEVKETTLRLLAAMTEEDLAQPEKGFPWTGETRLSRMLYLMRHTQQHIGAINRALRMNGCEPAEWR